MAKVKENKKLNWRQDTQYYLGIECGATKGHLLLVNDDGELVRRIETGPCNVTIVTDLELREFISKAAVSLPTPIGIGIAMAGARTTQQKDRIKQAVVSVWPGVPHWVGSDLEGAMTIAQRQSPGSVCVVVISGTGSAVYGRRKNEEVRVGGWGHLLGDRGSGYSIALSALRAVIQEFDVSGLWPKLGTRLLQRLLLNEPFDLVGWLQTAKKGQVASLCVDVLEASAGGDPLARKVTEACAGDLAEDTIACIRRLTQRCRNQKICVNFTGSVLLKSKSFSTSVAQRIYAEAPEVVVKNLEGDSAWGAVFMSQEISISAKSQKRKHPRYSNRSSLEFLGTNPLPSAVEPSPTELKHPLSKNFSSMPIKQAIQLIFQEEEKSLRLLRKESHKIVTAVEIVTNALKSKGRLFYVGAGTSGRLGVLDAAECPPTFCTPHEMVQGIIAGGQKALWSSAEAAEDSLESGERAISYRGINDNDVVIGITASGQAAFVWGALKSAMNIGASTILVTFNPNLKFKRRCTPTLVLSAHLGPELLTGSTRMKSGTATKVLLNMISTLSMTSMGKVSGNLMTHVRPCNRKLKKRAVGIVADITGASSDDAEAALINCNWSIQSVLKQRDQSECQKRLSM